MPFCVLQSSDPSTTSSSLVQCSSRRWIALGAVTLCLSLIAATIIVLSFSGGPSGPSKGRRGDIAEPLLSASDLLRSFWNEVDNGKRNSVVLQDWPTVGGKVDSLLTTAERAISGTKGDSKYLEMPCGFFVMLTMANSQFNDLRDFIQTRPTFLLGAHIPIPSCWTLSMRPNTTWPL